jgi:hypothetical protein
MPTTSSALGLDSPWALIIISILTFIEPKKRCDVVSVVYDKKCFKPFVSDKS